MSTKYKEFTCPQMGIPFGILNDNFDEIAEDIDNLKKEQDAIKVADLYRNESILCDAEGEFNVFEAGKHPTMKLIGGFIQAADNIKQDITIRILYGRKNRELSKASIKGSEKSGKTQALKVVKWKSINQHDGMIIRTNNRRKVIVHMRFEVIE